MRSLALSLTLLTDLALAPAALSQQLPLPNIIYPDPTQSDDQEASKPGRAVTGTGFFVASDGSLLTAAHVVSACRQTRIASQLVKPADARLLATDATHDVALLRAQHVTPPAVLPVGRPAAQTGRLFVLGYPESGGPLVPSETWAMLANDRLPPAQQEFADPRRMIWAEAPAINHGYSGGPMLDPRNGEVVGIVHGIVDSRRLHTELAAIPASGMVVGTGSAPLSALLRDEGTDTDTEMVAGDEALDVARRATVHVICLH